MQFWIIFKFKYSIPQVDDYKDEYLKLMSMYAILLAQSVEDPIVSDVEYAYDADGAAANGHRPADWAGWRGLQSWFLTRLTGGSLV